MFVFKIYIRCEYGLLNIHTCSILFNPHWVFIFDFFFFIFRLKFTGRKWIIRLLICTNFWFRIEEPSQINLIWNRVTSDLPGSSELQFSLTKNMKLKFIIFFILYFHINKHATFFNVLNMQIQSCTRYSQDLDLHLIKNLSFIFLQFNRSSKKII